VVQQFTLFRCTVPHTSTFQNGRLRERGVHLMQRIARTLRRRMPAAQA
jgi:hypothetical protein